MVSDKTDVTWVSLELVTDERRCFGRFRGRQRKTLAFGKLKQWEESGQGLRVCHNVSYGRGSVLPWRGSVLPRPYLHDQDVDAVLKVKVGNG